MNRNYTLFLFLILYLSAFTLSAQGGDIEVSDSKVASIWKGFNRYDFQFQEREARVIVPKEALPSKPWIWRARFPNWHTEADSILVSEGFHLVYINTDNMFGSPQAVSIWDAFYEFLITEYNLHRKVALMGVSRGGLFVYNWAKKNPEKVACIYAEAPVCDFKSWPAGFGSSEGSPKAWIRLKEEYGFASDTAAKLYSNNPVDNLKPLADAKIPILHMVGLEDKIVPPEENTFKLVDIYLRAGGSATIVPCTEGEQRLEGHHFPIETPRIVADFIKYHTIPKRPLDASNYHEMGNGLRNSQLVFERSKKGRVAFLGGSITYSPGWRDSICAYLTIRFPETEFEFIAAGIPSMGTTPAAFRLERDVLAHGKIDLLFEEAAVNDATNDRSTDEQIRGMEGIIRHLRKSNPKIDIVMMHFVDPVKIADYNNGKEPEVICNHNRVAKHYGIPTMNLAKEVRDRINNQEFTWEDDFKNLHPSPFGQGIYASSMLQFLDKAYEVNVTNEQKIISPDLPYSIDRQSYDGGHLMDISTAELKGNWNITPNWKPKDKAGTRPNYVNVPMLECTNPGNIVKFKFEGNVVGVAVAAGQDAGMIEYRVDNGQWTTLNLFTRWSQNLHLPWYYTLATGLSEQEHQLEIRVAETKDENSTGHACRIRYFYVNK